MHHHNKIGVYDYHKELETRFMDLYENKISKFGEPVDTELAQYVEGLGNWARAGDQWGFESERYFGKKGPEIGKTRCVTLLPKGRSEHIGCNSSTMLCCKSINSLTLATRISSAGTLSIREYNLVSCRM
ncbi:hypothetical protein EDB89DRAFT_844032 [Lactarius sanguifluus]|nr:hypothetical protein EDB89DRAFT_844032 [Lactarius sanguifluus]